MNESVQSKNISYSWLPHLLAEIAGHSLLYYGYKKGYYDKETWALLALDIVSLHSLELYLNNE